MFGDEYSFKPPDGTALVAIGRPDADGRLIAELRSTVPAAQACSYCGGPRSKNGARLIRFRDVPVEGHPVFVHWNRQKFICRACRRCSHDGHPAFDERRNMTVRFINWISENAKRKTFKAISKDAGTNDTLVRNAFHTGKNQSGHDIASLSDVLAIELVELAGRLRPAIIDVKKKIVFDVFASAEKFYEELCFYNSSPTPNFGEISLLVADIRLTIPVSIVKNAEQVVVSRSSVEREAGLLIMAACETLFANLQQVEQLSTRLARVLFLRRRDSLKQSAKLRLDSWRQIAPELYDAYDFKERFMEIWGSGEEKVRWKKWKAEAFSYRKLYFGDVLKLIDGRIDEIIGYYDHIDLAEFFDSLYGIVGDCRKRGTHSFSASRATLRQSHQSTVGWLHLAQCG